MKNAATRAVLHIHVDGIAPGYPMNVVAAMVGDAAHQAQSDGELGTVVLSTTLPIAAGRNLASLCGYHASWLILCGGAWAATRNGSVQLVAQDLRVDPLAAYLLERHCEKQGMAVWRFLGDRTWGMNALATASQAPWECRQQPFFGDRLNPELAPQMMVVSAASPHRVGAVDRLRQSHFSGLHMHVLSDDHVAFVPEGADPSTAYELVRLRLGVEAEAVTHVRVDVLGEQ